MSMDYSMTVEVDRCRWQAHGTETHGASTSIVHSDTSEHDSMSTTSLHAVTSSHQ